MYSKLLNKRNAYWISGISLLALFALSLLFILRLQGSQSNDKNYYIEAQMFCEKIGEKSRQFHLANGRFPTNLGDINLSNEDVPYYVAYPFEIEFNGLDGGPYCVYKGENMIISEFVFYDLKKDVSVNIDMGG